MVVMVTAPRPTGDGGGEEEEEEEERHTGVESKFEGSTVQNVALAKREAGFPARRDPGARPLAARGGPPEGGSRPSWKRGARHGTGARGPAVSRRGPTEGEKAAALGQEAMGGGPSSAGGQHAPRACKKKTSGRRGLRRAGRRRVQGGRGGGGTGGSRLQWARSRHV
ncbi:unnamed protein product [Prorocentrum cordatum]|uniref:Uncharacterized protein n=1 Tax=Prorocentrum cordatum TaxID=2364126 RepID=A0ABN9SVB3_9DINO|nr:unnamed protein product [Polarella glacialis]